MVVLKTHLSEHTRKRNNTRNIRMNVKVILVESEADNCNCQSQDKGRSELQ
jgi:hypothetical protein